MMSYAPNRNKINVVHVVGRMRDGGAEALLRTLVPKLAKEPDLDMHFLSIYDPNLSADERASLGVPLHEVGRRSRVDVTFASRLVGTLRRLRPDVVHAHSHSGKFAGRIAAIAAGVPNIVFSEHGDDASGIIHWSVSRLLNARTARFVVFTDDERRRYAAEQHLPLSRVTVIPNGIAVPATTDAAATRAELGVSVDDFAIAIPARLVQQKNHQLLIRAAAALQAELKCGVRLFVIGEGPNAGALETLVSELGMTATVRFLGYRRDAQRLTAACDVLALSSLWEKMPLVVGEAMLSGVPVVSTPWTGVDTFIVDGETGYLASDFSVDGLRSALARAQADATARQQIAARAKLAASDRFNLDRGVRLHAQLYRELTEVRGALNAAVRAPG